MKKEIAAITAKVQEWELKQIDKKQKIDVLQKMFAEQKNINPILEVFQRLHDGLKTKWEGKTPEQIKQEKWPLKGQELALRRYLKIKGIEQVKIEKARYNWT